MSRGSALIASTVDGSRPKIHQQFSGPIIEDISIRVICEGVPTAGYDIEENRRE